MARNKPENKKHKVIVINKVKVKVKKKVILMSQVLVKILVKNLVKVIYSSTIFINRTFTVGTDIQVNSSLSNHNLKPIPFM